MSVVMNLPGSFYLGRRYDLADRKRTDVQVHYESKHLTTHALCVGMTGSGKTGLCVSLLEEAALDGIPIICIDPQRGPWQPAFDLPGTQTRGLPTLAR